MNTLETSIRLSLAEINKLIPILSANIDNHEILFKIIKAKKKLLKHADNQSTKQPDNSAVQGSQDNEISAILKKIENNEILTNAENAAYMNHLMGI